MDALLKKLNYKAPEVMFIFNPPQSFKEMLHSAGNLHFKGELDPRDKVHFAMAFVTTLQQIEGVLAQVGPKLDGDAILWMCYPKGSSKKYTCEFNRDTGWAALGKYQLEPVRQVAIDEDWSALRFRKLEYIKNLTRKFGLLSQS